MNQRFYSLLGCKVLICLLAVYLRVEAQQPAWSETGALTTARTLHTATLLLNGKVLVVGGSSSLESPCCNAVGSAELYDPATGQWSATSSPITARVFHVAVRLANGKVLIAGGSNDDLLGPFTSAELYDPDSGKWSAAGNLRFRRSGHAATLLADGRVLVSGGSDPSAEIYDPVNNTWSSISPMNFTRNGHASVLLPKGKVLVVGGAFGSRLNPKDIPAEIYDPATGQWTVTGGLTTRAVRYPAVLLTNGQVLIAGGESNDNFTPFAVNETQVYNPLTGQWRATGSLQKDRLGHTLTLLPNAKVLAVGGLGGGVLFPFRHNTAELYDPATGSWTLTAELALPRKGHTATLLPNGQVLIAGGLVIRDVVGPKTTVSAILFDSGTPTVANLSAASFATGPLAPEAIVAAFGNNLAPGTQTAAVLPLPTQLAGATVRVRDSAGAERDAALFFVSPNQISYQIPPGTANGLSTITVSGTAMGIVEITSVAPGLFSANANGQGVAAAVALRVRADGSQSFEPVAQFDAAQNRFVAAAIDLGLDLGSASDQVFLILYGTGIRFRSALTAVSVTLGGTRCEALFADAAPGFVGLDQVNVRLPRSLAGRSEVDVALSANGWEANRVRVSIH